MSAEWRRIQIAGGHSLRARRSTKPASVPGRVVIINTRRAPIEIDEERWDKAEKCDAR